MNVKLLNNDKVIKSFKFSLKKIDILMRGKRVHRYLDHHNKDGVIQSFESGHKVKSLETKKDLHCAMFAATSTI